MEFRIIFKYIEKNTWHAKRTISDPRLLSGKYGKYGLILIAKVIQPIVYSKPAQNMVNYFEIQLNENIDGKMACLQSYIEELYNPASTEYGIALAKSKHGGFGSQRGFLGVECLFLTL